MKYFKPSLKKKLWQLKIISKTEKIADVAMSKVASPCAHQIETIVNLTIAHL